MASMNVSIAALVAGFFGMAREVNENYCTPGSNRSM